MREFKRPKQTHTNKPTLRNPLKTQVRKQMHFPKHWKSQHKRLQNGDISLTKNSLNIHVDMGVDGYIWYQKNGNSLLANLLLREHLSEMDNYMDRLVEFHKQVNSEDIRHLLEEPLKSN